MPAVEFFFSSFDHARSVGWNLSRYPWHIVKYRSDRRSPIKGEVLHLGQKFETQGTTDIGHNQWDQFKNRNMCGSVMFYCQWVGLSEELQENPTFFNGKIYGFLQIFP